MSGVYHGGIGSTVACPTSDAGSGIYVQKDGRESREYLIKHTIMVLRYTFGSPQAGFVPTGRLISIPCPYLSPFYGVVVHMFQYYILYPTSRRKALRLAISSSFSIPLGLNPSTTPKMARPCSVCATTTSTGFAVAQ